MPSEGMPFEDFYLRSGKKLIIRHSLQISSYVLSILLYRILIRCVDKNSCFILTNNKNRIQKIFGSEWDNMTREIKDSFVLKSKLGSISGDKMPTLIFDNISNATSEELLCIRELCSSCPHIILQSFYADDNLAKKIKDISPISSFCYWNLNIYPIVNYKTMMCPISDRQRLQHEIGSSSSITSPRFENNIGGSYRPQVKFALEERSKQSTVAQSSYANASVIRDSSEVSFERLIVKSIDYYKYTSDNDDLLDILPVECTDKNVEQYYQDLGQISSKLRSILTNIILHRHDRHLIIADGHVIKVLPIILTYLKINILEIDDNSDNSGVIINTPDKNICQYNIRYLHLWRIYSSIIDIIYENVQRSTNNNLNVNICNYVTIHRDGSHTTDSRLYEKLCQRLMCVKPKQNYKIYTEDGIYKVKFNNKS